jgi:FlaA1/EpsC-like NDP-sugar epimerase
MLRGRETLDTGRAELPGTEVVVLSDAAQAVARNLRRASVSPDSVAGIAFALEAAALALGLWFAGFASARDGFAPMATAGLVAGLAVGLSLVGWLLGSFELTNLQRFGRGAANTLCMAIPTAIIAGVDPLATFFVVVLVLPARALAAQLARAVLDFGLTERRAIIVGGGDRALRVLAALGASGADIRVCGIFDDRDDGRSPPVLRGVPKLGTLGSLVSFVRSAEIDMLIVTLPLSADRRIREILKAVEVLPVDVRLSDFSDDPAFARRSAQVGQGGLIDVMSRPLRQRQRMMKRAIDVVGAVAAIVALSPVLLATALAIRLETPGPILFRQSRH